MTVLLVLIGFVVGAGGGSLVTHRLHRQHTAGLEDLELKADMCDWFRDCADRLVDQLDTAEHAVDTLRSTVADQAVIVRAALGRPQKRRAPGGTP